LRSLIIKGMLLKKKGTKPEVSNSNVHGHIHGRWNENLCNTGGVEEGNFIRRINENPEGLAL